MRLARIKERILICLAWRMPRSLVYWCSIRLMVHATVGRYASQVVPELTAVDALKRWGDNDAIHWNPYNKVVQDHRDGSIHEARTNAERELRGLPVPWTPSRGHAEVLEPPQF
jgi:hypothetical protein